LIGTSGARLLPKSTSISIGTLFVRWL